jgi:hypothetical protein
VRVVLVLVSLLLCHSLITLHLEAKLTLVTISPTIVTVELHNLRLELGMGLPLGFSPLDFLTGFSSLAFALSLAKNTFPKVLTNLIGFWKSFVYEGNTGGAGNVSSRFLRWFSLGGKALL